jgi:lysophospholipase L1-like esterase
MRICFFGESYVNGVGDPTTQGWVGRLCAGRGLTVYNCGIRGATSTLIRDTWLAEAAARFNPSEKFAVVFSYGTNDCWRVGDKPQVSLDDHLANTSLILKEASSRWPTLFVGPPGLPAYTDHTMRESDHAERCARIKSLCRDLSIPFFDTLAVFGQFKHWRAEASVNDGAHPGAGGYAEMAAALDGWDAWKTILTPST